MHATTDFSDLSLVRPPAQERSLAAGDPVLADLLDRLSRQPDFPSLAEALSGVRRVARSEKARLQNLSEALLRDVGLSHKVLRLANAAHYRAAGGGQIDSISRAVAVMGFVEIGKIALSARLVSQLASRRHSLVLREEFLRSLLAGAMAHELAHRQAEDGYLIAVFRNLGRMVACLHFPEQAIAVRAATPRDRWPLGNAEQEASARILGCPYDLLGQAVAERWGWPLQLRRAIRRGQDAPDEFPSSRTEQLHCMGWLANEMADLLLYVAPERRAAACEALAARLGPATAHDGRSIAQALAAARMKLQALCEQLELPLSQLPQWAGTPDLLTSLARRDDAVVDLEPSAMREDGQASPPAATCEADPAAGEEPPADPAGAESDDAGEDLLRESVHEIVDAMAACTDTSALQLRILGGLMRGLSAHRAVLCLREEPSGRLVGRVGVAQEGDPLHQHFVVPADGGRDLFSVLCHRGADSCIDDARDPVIASRLPAWWRTHVASRSFLVLPMLHGGRCVGMIYCDGPRVGALRVSDRSMKLVRTLRNQALLAWRMGD